MQDLGFTYGRALRDGNHVSVARFTCRCGQTHDQVMRPGQTANPEEIAKRARRDGWEAHSHKASATMCPACLAARRAKRRMPRSAPPPIPLDPAGTPAAEAIAAAIQAHPTIQDMEEKPPMSSTTAAKPQPAPAVTLPREATTAERMKIRALLDANFDDATGAYLVGYSDQQIADEVKVPRAIVSRIREVGYGPIKVNPEIEALREAFHAHCKRVSEESKRSAAEIADLSARLAKLAGKPAA